MGAEYLKEITRQFFLEGTIDSVSFLGKGLINDTYLVKTREVEKPDYVLQRINHQIFTDVEMLQHNIEAVTDHLRRKLLAEGVVDVDRRVLRFVPSSTGETYHFDGGNYWRISVYIADTMTVEEVTPKSSYDCGRAFGHFQQQLTDLDEPLGETIPNFHNMKLRISQLREAVANDTAGRVKEVRKELELIETHADEMCLVSKEYFRLMKMEQ